MRRRLRLGQDDLSRFAITPEAVDAQVERRASQQRRLRVGIDQWIEPLEQPDRSNAAFRDRFPSDDRHRAVGRAVEQRRQVRILASQAEHRSAARNRALAGAAHGTEHQLADRAPILRAGIAAHLEPAGTMVSAAAPLSRAAMMIASNSSIAAWTRAAGVMGPPPVSHRGMTASPHPRTG
jgi:hypothetical protein